MVDRDEEKWKEEGMIGREEEEDESGTIGEDKERKWE